MSCYVLAQAAWMPGRPNATTVVENHAVMNTTAPAIDSYPSRLMRGTSTCTRMGAAVASQALAGTAVDPRSIPAVFGSAFGELCIAIEQLEMMVSGDGQVSPALFKNSVHNTAAGIFSIAHGNHTMSTTLAAGPLTVAYTLLEAQAVLDGGAPYVLAVVGDEELPEPLTQFTPWQSFAAAWVLGRDAPRDRPRIHLSRLLPLGGPMIEIPDGLAAHPCRAAHTLLTAVHHRRPGTISLGEGYDEAWSTVVTVESENMRHEHV